MVIKNVDPNVVFVLEKLQDKHTKDFYLFGDSVRALVSSCSTMYDEHDIITNDMSILYTLPLAAKQRTWTIRDNVDRPQYQKDKNFGSLYLVSAFFDEDIIEEDEPSVDSYLTPKDIIYLEEKGVDLKRHKMTLNNLYIESVDSRMVPEKATAIFKYQYYGMNFRIHISENPKEYVYHLHDKISALPANKCFISPEDRAISALDPKELRELQELTLSGFHSISDEKEKQKYLELSKIGWKDVDDVYAGRISTKKVAFA